MINLICPVCKQQLNKENKSYKCDSNHCFDMAKEGYVNLLTGILKIRLDNNPDGVPYSAHRKDVKVIKDSKIKIAKEELDALKGIND